jgi:pimeloyl-ACP methyl ester carboxylesterase
MTPLLFIILVGLALGAVAITVAARVTLRQWMRAPLPPGRLVVSGDGRWYVTIKGQGQFTLVIEPCLGAPSPEWWPIQDALANRARVVTYDHAGYGWSEASAAPRTSAQIAIELHAVLHDANICGPYVLIGHSQGGLYAQHFARLYPDEVAGCIFLDPVSPQNDRFAQELSTRVFRGSGVDKLPAIKLMGTLCKLGILPLLKPLLMKSPPFYYYKNLPRDVVETLWRHHLRPELYATAVAEYTQAFQAANLARLLERPFPNIPLTVIYHNAAIIIDEIVRYGGLSREEAQQVESLWEQLTRSYLELACESRWIVAEHSSHFIPLDQPDLVIAAITEMPSALENESLPT